MRINNLLGLFSLTVSLVLLALPATSQNTAAGQDAYLNCMSHKPKNATQCYDISCNFQRCVASYSTSNMFGAGLQDKAAAVAAAQSDCKPIADLIGPCIQEHGIITPPHEPPKPAKSKMSCGAKDNEEKGCCCFLGAHTYLFDPRKVNALTATFDTGRKLNCESTVGVSVRLANDLWVPLVKKSVKSSNGNSEVAPRTITTGVGKVISGVSIADGCVCCIDDSRISLE